MYNKCGNMHGVTLKIWYTSFSETSKEDRLAITAVSSSSSSVVAVVTVVLVLVLVKTVVAMMRTVMNTIDETCIILFLLQFWKLLIGGGIVPDML